MQKSVRNIVRFLCVFVAALVVLGAPTVARAAQGTQLESDVTSATISAGTFSSWLSQPVTVTLQAPSWASATQYHFGGGNFLPYSQPLRVSTEGKTTLYFQSSSTGSIEPLQTAEVWLDFKAPTMPGDVVYSKPQSDGFSYNFGPSKDFLSGVESYDVTVTSVATSSTVLAETVASTSGSVSTLSAGTYDFTYVARDYAGNISLPRQSQVMVGLDKPVITYAFDDPEVSTKVAQGAWITEGIDVGLTASIASEAPTSTIRLKTLSGSLTTTDVAQTRYSSVPLKILDEGQGKVTLGVTDLFGNESEEASFTLKVDRTAPPSPVFLGVKTATAVSDATKRNLVVSWSPVSDAASGIDYYCVIIARRGDGFAGITQHNVSASNTVFADVEPGTYDITLQAFDRAGLASSVSTISKRVTLVSRAEAAAGSESNNSSSDGSDDSASSDDSDETDSATLVADSATAGTSAVDADSSSDNDGEDELLSAYEASRDNEATQSFWEKAVAYLKNEWMIWVPILLGLIALAIVIVFLVKHRGQKNSPHEPTSPEEDSFATFLDLPSDSSSTSAPTQKLTAQPVSDQAVNYFKINDKN